MQSSAKIMHDRCEESKRLPRSAHRAVALQQDGQVDDQGLEGPLHQAHHIGRAARAAHIHIHLYVVRAPAPSPFISPSHVRSILGNNVLATLPSEAAQNICQARMTKCLSSRRGLEESSIMQGSW